MSLVGKILIGVLALFATGLAAVAPASAQQQKPNILVIMGDDIGYWNISAYNRGMMGYRTPNIDRIANEGAIFTDYYGQQSCTAGRAAFITGQSPLRTGLLKVGLPGAKEGLSDKDPTLAELLKPQGYVTGQFGKNHLGDRNEFLPTVHGFDEFFGNLYHLNAEDEPEHPDYPKNHGIQAALRSARRAEMHGDRHRNAGRRSALRQVGQAELRPTPARSPRSAWRRWTKNFSPLRSTSSTAPTATRSRSSPGSTPTRMHIWTRLKPESQGKTGLGIYPDGMVEHDAEVGQLLKKLDDLGIANNTIVIYTTDNGAETFTWPDGGTTPFRGEKNTNWEGSYRVPALIRWPGLVAAAHRDQRHLLGGRLGVDLDRRGGRARHQEQTAEGLRRRRQDIQGAPRRLRPARHARRQGPRPRREFFYWTDDGNFAGLRYDQYKAVFMEQPAHGLEVWMQPFVPLRAPKLFNLRSDPFERAEHEAGDYVRWFIEHIFVLVPAQAIVGQLLATFQEFPPRQKPGSFSVDQALQKLSNQEGSN